MPILRLNAGPEGLEIHGSPAPAWPTIRNVARGKGPVIIMIHGFKYDPACAPCSPHSTIFALRKRPDRTEDVLWPKHLGFGTGRAEEGLAIAYGWKARGNLWRAQKSSVAAGLHLGRVIRAIKAVAPERPVHIVTHSMGSEVAFEALDGLPAQSVARLITITGASYVSRAEAAMASPAGRTTELINVTSRENDVFDYMFECLIPRPVRGDVAMSAGVDAPNAVTLQLDCARTLRTLRLFGADIATPARRVCHWSGYTRPGAMRFYARLFREMEQVPLEAMQAVLPKETQPRWSRLVAPGADGDGLPELRKTA